MILTEMPAYLYYNAELPRRGDGALFHYTKFDSFLKILEDMTLLPSSFGRLNDMNEGNVSNMNMNENFKVMYDAEKYIKERCHLLSFSQNYDICFFVYHNANAIRIVSIVSPHGRMVCTLMPESAYIIVL